MSQNLKGINIDIVNLCQTLLPIYLFDVTVGQLSSLLLIELLVVCA
jgi:hypothetical protein